MPRTTTGRALTGARIVLGLLTIFAPRLAGRLFLLNPDDNPQLPYVGRMWGIRNLALAAGLIGARGAGRRRWWQVNVAVDAADAVASYAGWRQGELKTATAVLVTATAVVAAGLGAASVAGESEG